MRPFISIKEQLNVNKANEVIGRILNVNKTNEETQTKVEEDYENSVYLPVNKKYNVSLSDHEIAAYLVINFFIYFKTLKRKIIFLIIFKLKTF